MNAQDIKLALNERAQEFVSWLLPAGRKNGNNWLVGSLGGERGSSLSICINSRKCGVFCDFATGEKGNNLIELLARVKQVEFKSALHESARWLGESIPTYPQTIRAEASVTLQPRNHADLSGLSDSECDRGRRMAERLKDDPQLCERLARSRNWQGKTLRDLAHEASLGFDDGKLAFLYDTGVKLRWRVNGERIIKWAFGKPWIWRGSFLCCAQTVYLCEGETDAISLIDAGVESERTTLAVALPSASTFNQEWASLFHGKRVILAFDSDEAGRAATTRVCRFLRPHAETLKQLDWEGVQHAC